MGNLSDVIEDLNIEPSQGFDLLPPGEYSATVTWSEVVPTSKGDGTLLKIIEQIWSPEQYAGRTLKANFTIAHPNQDAERIGRGKLSALAQACGLPPGIPADSKMLHEKQHIIKVTVQEGTGKNPATGEPYGPKNEIRGYYPTKKAATAPKAPATPGAARKGPTLEEDELPYSLG